MTKNKPSRVKKSQRIYRRTYSLFGWAFLYCPQCGRKQRIYAHNDELYKMQQNHEYFHCPYCE